MEYLFNVCRMCLVPNFYNNYRSIFDNNGKCATELFFLAGISFNDERVNFPSLICDDCTTLLEKSFNCRQQCLKSQEYLRKHLYPFQNTPPQAIPSYLPDLFQAFPNNYHANIPEAEQLEIQKNHDTTNDVGLNEQFSSDENECNVSFIDLTEGTDDNSEVHIVEYDSGFGGSTPDIIDSNANALKPISEQTNNAHQNKQIANKAPKLSQFRNHATAQVEKSSKNSPDFITRLNRNRSFCNICQKSFNKRAVKRHITLIHSVRNFVCDLCGKRFKDEPNVKRHIYLLHQVPMIQHMEEIKADSKITGRRKTTCFERSFSTWFNFFVCHVCKETCLSEDLLKNHMKLNHNVKNIICDMCDKRFRNKRGLLQHMRKSHKNPIKREQETVDPNAINLAIRRKSIAECKAYKCMICQKKYENTIKLNRHMDKHPKEFQCPYCTMKSHYLYIFKSHFRHHHQDLLNNQNQ